MKALRHTLLTLLFSFILLSPASAQNAASPGSSDPVLPKKTRLMNFRTWELGGNFGVLIPSTDISSYRLSSSMQNIGYGITATKFVSPSIGIQGRFLRGTLRGEQLSTQRQYETDIKADFTVNAVVQFGNMTFLRRKSPLNFYAYVGYGFINYDPRASVDGGATYSNYEDRLDNLVEVDYSNTTEFVIPFGVGLKYHVSPEVAVTAEYSSRRTQSDKLDGFYSLLSNKDFYNYFNVGFHYMLGKKSKRNIQQVNPMYEALKIQRARADSAIQAHTSRANNAFLPSIFFNTGSSVVDIRFNETLATVAFYLLNHPDVRLEVIGRCDNAPGSGDDFTSHTAMDRAQAVVKHLISNYGVDAGRVIAVSGDPAQKPLSKDPKFEQRVDFNVLEL